MSTVMLQVVEPRGAPCGGTRGRGAVVLDKNQNFGNRLVLVDIMIHNPSRARTTTNPQKQHSITDNLGALRVSYAAWRAGTARHDGPVPWALHSLHLVALEPDARDVHRRHVPARIAHKVKRLGVATRHLPKAGRVTKLRARPLRTRAAGLPRARRWLAHHHAERVHAGRDRKQRPRICAGTEAWAGNARTHRRLSGRAGSSQEGSRAPAYSLRESWPRATLSAR